MPSPTCSTQDRCPSGPRWLMRSRMRSRRLSGRSPFGATTATNPHILRLLPLSLGSLRCPGGGSGLMPQTLARQFLFMLLHQTLEHGLGTTAHMPLRDQCRDSIDHPGHMLAVPKRGCCYQRIVGRPRDALGGFLIAYFPDDVPEDIWIVFEGQVVVARAQHPEIGSPDQDLCTLSECRLEQSRGHRRKHIAPVQTWKARRLGLVETRVRLVDHEGRHPIRDTPVRVPQTASTLGTQTPAAISQKSQPLLSQEDLI